MTHFLSNDWKCITCITCHPVYHAINYSSRRRQRQHSFLSLAKVRQYIILAHGREECYIIPSGVFQRSSINELMYPQNLVGYGYCTTGTTYIRMHCVSVPPNFQQLGPLDSISDFRTRTKFGTPKDCSHYGLRLPEHRSLDCSLSGASCFTDPSFWRVRWCRNNNGVDQMEPDLPRFLHYYVHLQRHWKCL